MFVGIDFGTSNSSIEIYQHGALSGSLEIPLFVDRLVQRFGAERMREINPFTPIVGGLALKGHELVMRKFRR